MSNPITRTQAPVAVATPPPATTASPTLTRSQTARWVPASRPRLPPHRDIPGFRGGSAVVK